MSESKANCTKLLDDLMCTKSFNWKSVDVAMESRDDVFYNCVSFCPFEFSQDIVIPKGKYAYCYIKVRISLSFEGWNVMLI